MSAIKQMLLARVPSIIAMPQQSKGVRTSRVMAQQPNLSDQQPEAFTKPQDDLEIRTSLDPDTHKFLKIIEARFDCEFRNQQRALAQMPQRVLSEEAKEALKKSLEQDLKAEIQQELKPQLDQLRDSNEELRKQIDELKKKRN